MVAVVTGIVLAVAAGHDPCLLVALGMIEDLEGAERRFAPGTTLRLDTWLMGPRLRRKAEVYGWMVELLPPTWQVRVDLHMSRLLMPRAARQHCRGPLAHGSAAMFRVWKTV